MCLEEQTDKLVWLWLVEKSFLFLQRWSDTIGVKEQMLKVVYQPNFTLHFERWDHF